MRISVLLHFENHGVEIIVAILIEVVCVPQMQEQNLSNCSFSIIIKLTLQNNLF